MGKSKKIKGTWEAFTDDFIVNYDEERRIGYKAMEKETQLERMAKNKEWRERKRNTGSSNSLRDQFLDDCISNR